MSPGLNKNGLTVGALDVKYAVWEKQVTYFDEDLQQWANNSISLATPDYRVAFFSGAFTG